MSNEAGSGHPVVFYDGLCGFCNKLVQFVLERDRRDVFRFASLQSPLAAEVLARHRRDPKFLDTVYVVLDDGLPTERLLSKARAALFIARTLGGPIGATRVFGILPDFVLNAGYNLVASVRYRLFGKHDACPLPDPKQRYKFLDV